jgi:hypothetical protein
MKYAIKRYLGFAAVMVGCLGGLACESEELSHPTATPPPSERAAAATEGLNTAPPSMNAQERVEFDRENAGIRCRETGSASELSIRWQKAAETSATELTAIVTNHGSSNVTAEPVLVAANPSLGEAREQRLDPVSLAPGAETALTVKVADFPVQSVGEASSVSIGLRWKREDTQAEMVSPQALSEPLFVTHDDDTFRTAVLREHESELTRRLTTTSKAKSSERRLTRAVALTGARRFETIERPDTPTLVAGAPVLDQPTRVNGAPVLDQPTLTDGSPR